MILLTDEEVEDIEEAAHNEWCKATSFYPTAPTIAIRKAEAAILAKLLLALKALEGVKHD
jgi:hypothetical protein